MHVKTEYTCELCGKKSDDEYIITLCEKSHKIPANVIAANWIRTLKYNMCGVNDDRAYAYGTGAKYPTFVEIVMDDNTTALYTFSRTMEGQNHE